MEKESIIKFSFVLLSLIIIGGLSLYYYLPETVWSGFGLSSAMMSVPSLIHLKTREQAKEGSIESIFTWLLLLCIILGIVLIFIYKWLGGSNFLIGIGGGITLVSALTYCIELLIRFVEGIR